MAPTNLEEYLFYFLPVGLTKTRIKVLRTQAEKRGGKVIANENELAKCFATNSNLIFICLIDENLDVPKLKQFLPSWVMKSVQKPKLVRVSWLCECFKSEKLDNLSHHEICLDFDTRARTKKEEDSATNVGASTSKVTADDLILGNEDPIISTQGDHLNSEAANFDLKNMTKNLSSPPKRMKFICETSSKDEDAIPVNHNKAITDQLEILRDGYKSTSDKWRAMSYEKAINLLKAHPKAITSLEEAKNLRGIGDRLAEKIWEIIQSGTLRKAEAFQSDEKLQTLNCFTNIWGVGPNIASQWYTQGFRTLNDLREKAKLSKAQQIGLKYYDEFLQRMPHSEAGEIVDTVIKAVHEIKRDFICQGCGSYRRGKATCGDVDVLITHPDGVSHTHILGTVVKHLTDAGFLTDHLVESSEDETHTKYMGVCILPKENALHRRIDIIAVPFEEYATSLVYFTGSEHFVRSIYLKAKTMGMRLNGHSLRGGVLRQKGEVVHEGYVIDTPTEESVFEKLGIPYRTPAEREHP